MAYGRAEGEPEQETRKIAIAERAVKHLPAPDDADDDEQGRRRLAVPLSERLWELRHETAPASSLYTTAEILTAFNGAEEQPYEVELADGKKRKLAHVLHRYYDAADLPDPLADDADFLALPYETCAQSFTEGLLADAFEPGHAVDATLLASAGYQDRTATDGGWWSKSGRQVFDPAHFFLPIEILDPFDVSVTIAYDDYHLFTTTVTAPLGNVVSAQLDYRVLAPWEVTDPNGNRAQAAWDWEAEEALESVGVTPILYYDALGRLLRTELPNGTARRVVFTPWRMDAWDENDTVSDVGNLWYLARQPEADPEFSPEEQNAATLTWAHRKDPDRHPLRQPRPRLPGRAVPQALR